MAIDPGESSGIVLRAQGRVLGKTITGPNRLLDLWRLLQVYMPDVIIFEEFALRASTANKLIGNKFITCEVIGVIKLFASLHKRKLIPLKPANKMYCGFTANPKDPAFKEITLNGEKITEHVRDAFRLLRYGELFKLGGQNAKT